MSQFSDTSKPHSTVNVDTEEIAAFMFDRLVEKGFVPAEKEVDEISELFFEYLVQKNIVTESKDA